MDRPGRRSVRSHSPLKPRPASPFCLTGHVASSDQRGNTGGFSASSGPFIGASNLSSTKARLLLMATLMKLGSLPPARDPDQPTPDERAATDEKLAEYRRVFRCH